MSAYPQFRAATPRVIRMEMADLYVGDGTIVVQLDALPCETWIQNLRAFVSQCPELAAAKVEVEGSWVHFLGVRKAIGPVAPRLLEVIAAAGEMAYAPNTARPSMFASAEDLAML